MNLRIEAVGRKEFAIGGGRGRKASRDRHAEAAEVGYHLTEGGILAADDVHIIHAKLSELDDVWLQTMLPCVPVLEMDNQSPMTRPRMPAQDC